MKPTITGIIALFLWLMVMGCDQPAVDGKTTEVVRDKDGRIISGTYKKYNAAGKLEAVMHFKDRKLHGKATKYYADGKTVRSELNYDMGRLNGLQKRYYASGKLYKEEPFVMGKRHGLVKKYRESGLLMSEARYKNGFAGTDLKEYLTNGKLKKKYPIIVVEEDDNLLKNGTYTLRVYLSDKSKNVKYYLGKLDAGGYLHDGLDQQYNITDGVLTYTFPLQPGQIVQHRFDFVARTPTRLNNTFVTTRTHRVKIVYPR